jgi:adenosylcobinamide-phosphate synthase
MSAGYEHIILPAAFLMDLVLGDPEGAPHPIRWMGNLIKTWEKPFRRFPVAAIWSGSVFALVLVSGTWFITFIIVWAADFVNPWFGLFMNIVLIYYTLSVKSLKTESLKVLNQLESGSLSEAKKQLAQIVGRDVTPLDESGVTRAAVETVAENLVDGVISPLFYAALGGAPLAMAYKMVNTLDSMIGYKNKRYKEFGRVAAQLDDAANFIPARLAVMVVACAAFFVRLSPYRTFRMALRDGRKHLSPNAGIPEAAFAGALEIQLGGANYYQGELVEKPYIGEPIRPVKRNDIKRAVELMSVSSVVWFCVCWLLGSHACFVC